MCVLCGASAMSSAIKMSHILMQANAALVETLVKAPLVCFLSPGRLIKKVWRDVMDRHFFIIYNAIFNYQFDLFYCARRAGATGRKCTMTINARHASGCGLVAIFGIIVWESAPVFVSRWSGGYFIPIPSMFGHVGCIALS